MRTLLLSTLLALTLCGCGSPERARLERGVAYARDRLEAVNHDAVAAMTYGSIEEQGGTPVTFLTAGLPERTDLPGFAWNKPTQAWTVVLRNGPGPGDVTIEGYGTDLARPLKTVTVALHPGEARRVP